MRNANHTAVTTRPWFRRTEIISAIILITWMTPVGAQSISGRPGRITELRIDIDNYVPYNYDFFDPARFATLNDRTAAPPGVPFGQILIIGDIVAVDGLDKLQDGVKVAVRQEPGQEQDHGQDQSQGEGSGKTAP